MDAYSTAVERRGNRLKEVLKNHDLIVTLHSSPGADGTVDVYASRDCLRFSFIEDILKKLHAAFSES